MPVVSVGDMARQFTAMRNGGSIKSYLFRLTEQLSTGKVKDITAHLNGQTGRLTGINHSLVQLDGYLQSANETSQTLTGVQNVLQRVDSLRAEASKQLLLVSSNNQPAQIDEAARTARGSFDSMVSVLNTRLADRALMGGADVVSPPLAQAADIMADLQAYIGGATTQPDIIAAVDFWFNDPAGGFATMGYLGHTGDALEKKVARDTQIQIIARADDPAIKETMKAMAIAAVTHELSGLPRDIKSGMLQEAATRLLGAANGLIAMQSRVGFTEKLVERTTVETRSERTSLEIARNGMIAADPFDTASQLQAVQLQLETHYAATARASKLSLLEYI